MLYLLQEAVINELKSKTRQVKETRLLKQDEVYNGALEDILLGKIFFFNFFDLTLFLYLKQKLYNLFLSMTVEHFNILRKILYMLL